VSRPRAENAFSLHKKNAFQSRPCRKRIGPWILCAVVAALWAGAVKVQAGWNAPANGIVMSSAVPNPPTPRSASAPASRAVDLPGEYRSVQPAALDGTAPAIPPSRLRPAR
jgi:hypothetical protein